MSSVSVALKTYMHEKVLGKKGVEKFGKIMDPTGLLEKAEGEIAHYTAAFTPEWLGGTGKYDLIGNLLFV